MTRPPVDEEPRHTRERELQHLSGEAEAVHSFAAHRAALESVRHTLSAYAEEAISLSFVYQPATMELFHDIYGTDNRTEIIDASRREGSNDATLWRTLGGQAALAFDEPEQFRFTVGEVYLRGLDEMRPEARAVGVALATREIFAHLNYPELHTVDQALDGLQRVTGVDDETIEQSVRLWAVDVIRISYPNVSDRIFEEAVLEPTSRTRRAISDARGVIDLEIFGGIDIVGDNLRSSLLRAAHYGEADKLAIFQTIAAEYPHSATRLLDSDEFQTALKAKLRHRALHEVGKMPLPEIADVIGKEAVIAVWQRAEADLERFQARKNGLYDHEIAEVAAGYGWHSTSPHYYTEDTLRGVREVLKELQTPVPTPPKD